MAKTFGDIKVKIWGLLGQKSSSVTFSSSVIGELINSTIQQVLRGRYTSILDPSRIYSAGRMWINEGAYYTRINNVSTLTVAFAVGDTTLTCDPANLTTSGYVEIGGETFKYTGVTTTTLTGVTGGTTSKIVGSEVRQLYSMQTGYERPFRMNKVVGDKDVVKLEIPYSEMGDKSIYYQIVRVGTVKLIRIIGLMTNDLVEIIYTNQYIPMVNDSEVCVLPDSYAETVIAKIGAGEYGIEKGIPNAQNILVGGYAKLQDFYRYFDNEVYQVKKTLKPVSYKAQQGKITQ